MDKVRAKRIAAEMEGRKVGKWTVGQYLGNGASAVVVAGHCGEQTSAIKLIDPELVERYGRESQSARIDLERRLIGHSQPNLVRIYDGGICEESGFLYIAMEFLSHPSLSSVVSVFPTERIGPIIEQLARAAQYLESQEIAHRDIKPDNILITRDCDHSTLLDLGVIRVLADTADADAGTGDEFLGTTRYSPPEFVLREEEDSEDGWRAVTYYQLGAVLHDMIMRRPMFDGVSAPAAKLIDAVRHTRPAVNASEVPPHLVSLARNCLHKDWRVRLEVVRWEQFSASPPAITANTVKERIRSRLIAMTDASEEAPVVDIQIDRAHLRRMLTDSAGTLASTVRDLCLQGGLFPPIEVRVADDQENCRVVVRTGPAARYALDETLEINLLVGFVDNEGLIVRVDGVAVFGRLAADAGELNWQNIYSGEISAVGLKTRLDDFLHIALDAAQAIGQSATGEQIKIEWAES